MTKKRKAQILKQMQGIAMSDDPESAHMNADNLLCELLTELGFENLVEEYDKVKKWYA